MKSGQTPFKARFSRYDIKCSSDSLNEFIHTLKVLPFVPLTVKYIEDIYFFEVNTKYISSSELKTSKFSRVRSTSENLDVFNRVS